MFFNDKNDFYIISERLEVTSELKWIKANVNQTGFYRVMYDEDMWFSLISLLKSNHELFSSADRAGLIDDAFSLCRLVEIIMICLVGFTKNWIIKRQLLEKGPVRPKL